jgi:L-amino acid N-acyltransferase YncA
MADSDIKVRVAAAADKGQIESLVQRSASQLYSKIGSAEQCEAWASDAADDYMRRLSDPESQVLVADCPYGIVGTVYVSPKSSRPHGCDRELGGLYTALRGAGIGHLLNQQALLAAAAGGASSVYTAVSEANKPARRALEDMGFHRSGVFGQPFFPDHQWIEMEMHLLPGAFSPDSQGRIQRHRA